MHIFDRKFIFPIKFGTSEQIFIFWISKMFQISGSPTVNFQDALAQSTHIAEEKISNIRTVKSFGKEDQEMYRYDIEMKNVLDKTLKEALVQAKFYGMVCIV